MQEVAGGARRFNCTPHPLTGFSVARQAWDTSLAGFPHVLLPQQLRVC